MVLQRNCKFHYQKELVNFVVESLQNLMDYSCHKFNNKLNFKLQLLDHKLVAKIFMMARQSQFEFKQVFI